MRIQHQDSTKNQLKKSFNFEMNEFKKTRSFIEINQDSDQRLGEDSTSDNGNLTPVPNKTSDLTLTKQRSQNTPGGRFQTFTKHNNFSSFKKENEKTEEKRKESGRTDEEHKVEEENEEEFFQNLEQEQETLVNNRVTA